MKRLLLIALALVAAGSIAFAISAFTGSSCDRTPGPAQVQQDPSGGEGTLVMDNCIFDVDILYCYPDQLNQCRTAFTLKHWHKTDDCCAHDAGIIYFRLGGSGPYGAMTKGTSGYDGETDCYYDNYNSNEYVLGDDTRVIYDVYDTGDADHCKNSGSFYIDCW
ncbi:MAG: hypothetical protein JW759_08175 [Candidatus Coatesbacteria bacterium]|nr:hypothetical protein [Candidatus Coatesbacteria bacterium]